MNTGISSCSHINTRLSFQLLCQKPGETPQRLVDLQLETVWVQERCWAEEGTSLRPQAVSLGLVGPALRCSPWIFLDLCGRPPLETEPCRRLGRRTQGHSWLCNLWLKFGVTLQFLHRPEELLCRAHTPVKQFHGCSSSLLWGPALPGLPRVRWARSWCWPRIPCAVAGDELVPSSTELTPWAFAAALG